MAELGVFEDKRRKWLQFDVDTEVLVEHIDKEQMQVIRKKAEKAARMSGSDISEISNQMLGKASVYGWRNMDNHDHPGITINKQPVPFSDANRDMLMKRSLEFSNFVNESAINSREFLEIDEEAQEALKND